MGASRDTTKLHPDLQKIITQLKKDCEDAEYPITITECVRDVAYQNELYNKGRDANGKVVGKTVTNAKGTSYSSMHKWGVAFDFCRNDGKGAYNEDGNYFYEVGQIGKKYGLIWGGDWTSPVDKLHFQLSDWGDTAEQLKKLYGTPDNFMETWSGDGKEPAAVEKKEEKKETPNKNETDKPAGNTGTSLKQGSKGKEVTKLQENLKYLGFNPKGVDGSFGKNTKDAVIAFQKAYNLSVDGVAGNETQSKIDQLLNSSSGVNQIPSVPPKKDTKPPADTKKMTRVQKFKAEHGDLVKQYATELGVDENLLGAVILVESSSSGIVDGKLNLLLRIKAR